MTIVQEQPGPPIPVIRGGEVGMCLTRIHHNRFTEAVGEPSVAYERLANRGIAFEAEIIATILAGKRGTVAVINDHAGDPYQATATALEQRVDIVIGGRFRSPDGSLVGAPDLLVLMDDGYAPIEVKSHRIHADSGAPVALAPLDDLTRAVPEDDLRFRSWRKRDLLQVAHYRRILLTLGHASSRAVGGVIGTDEPIACTWVDLDTEDFPIMDEAIGWSDAAIDVIEYGEDNPDTPLEAPWWRGECQSCEWELLCRAQLKAVDDPTLISGITRETRDRLAELGITTGAAIAALDPDDERIGSASIVFDARVRAFGSLMTLEAPAGPIDVPAAPREVDFDIETYAGRIYLAGFLITEGGRSTFDPIVDWVGTDETELRFVGDMFDRLASYSDDDTVVLHWSDYERAQLQAAANRHDLSIRGYRDVSEWFDRHAVDLYQWTRSTFASPSGFSLKAIAPLCGFGWRDDDPGGLQSELWYELMLAGDTTMQQRLLEYNEDDVAAQLAIRRWIRTNGARVPWVGSWN